MIQTLKAEQKWLIDLQLSATANDGEQHKDNSNNIIKYLELKKNRILCFTRRITKPYGSIDK